MNEVEYKALKYLSQLAFRQPKVMNKEEYKALKEGSIRLILKHIPVETAREIVNESLKEVVKNVKNEKVYGLPRLDSMSDLGKEGVTDSDFEWYYNIGPIRVGIITEINNVINITGVEALKDTGLSEIEAMHELRKSMPIFGEKIGGRLGLLNLTERDENLPQLLQRRVEIYIARYKEQKPMKFLENLESFGTFNAFIRNEIRAGRLDDIENYGTSDAESVIRQFKSKIKEQEDFLFGVKLYNENIALLYDKNTVRWAGQHYEDIKQRGRESIICAKELLEEIKQSPEMVEYLFLFEFPAIHGDPILDEMTKRAKILVETYDELFHERSREKDLTEDERFLLIERASNKWNP